MASEEEEEQKKKMFKLELAKACLATVVDPKFKPTNPRFLLAQRLYPEQAKAILAFCDQLSKDESKIALTNSWAVDCNVLAAKPEKLQNLLNGGAAEHKENPRLMAFLHAFGNSAPVSQAEIAAATAAMNSLSLPGVIKNNLAIADISHMDRVQAGKEFKDLLAQLRLYQALQSLQ